MLTESGMKMLWHINCVFGITATSDNAAPIFDPYEARTLLQDNANVSESVKTLLRISIYYWMRLLTPHSYYSHE